MTLPKRALVVDDNDVNRLLASRLLGKAGWEICEAADGDQALAWMQANTARLVLLDISMPTISGEEVCRRAREKSLLAPGCKLVAYTAHAMPEERRQFLDAGFDAILTKPVSRQSLAALLEDLGLNGEASS